MEDSVHMEAAKRGMKEEEYIQYNDKDLLRFMQFLVKIELEESWDAVESLLIDNLSNVAGRCLVNRGTFVDFFCLEFNSQLTQETKNDLYHILFVTKFESLPMYINHKRRTLRLLVQWRLENGI